MVLPPHHAPDVRRTARPELRVVDDDTVRRARRASRRDRRVHEVTVLLETRPVLGGVSRVADVMAEALTWSV